MLPVTVLVKRLGCRLFRKMLLGKLQRFLSVRLVRERAKVLRECASPLLASLALVTRHRPHFLLLALVTHSKSTHPVSFCLVLGTVAILILVTTPIFQ